MARRNAAYREFSKEDDSEEYSNAPSDEEVDVYSSTYHRVESRHSTRKYREGEESPYDYHGDKLVPRAEAPPVPKPRTIVPGRCSRKPSSPSISPPPHHRDYDDEDQRHSEGETRKLKQKREVYFREHYPDREGVNERPSPRRNKEYRGRLQMRGEFGTFGYDEKELHHDEDDRLDTKYQDNVTTARNPQRLQQDRILPGKLIDYREWDGRDHEVYLQQRHNTAQGLAVRDYWHARNTKPQEHSRYGKQRIADYSSTDRDFRSSSRSVRRDPMQYDFDEYQYPYTASDGNYLSRKREDYYHPEDLNISLTKSTIDIQQNISQEHLVNILAHKKGLRATLLHLHEAFNLNIASLRAVISANSQIFRLIEEAVEIRINLKVCSFHNGASGCQNRLACRDLHICKKYTERKCNKNESCIMGHNWMTNHNTKIMRNLGLQHMSHDIIEKILISSVSATTDPSLDICSYYNNKGCRLSNCPNLHVCSSFVEGLAKCSRNNCRLNHDLLNNDCSRLLEAAGIDTNESPRDVLVALFEMNPTLRKRAESREYKDLQQLPPVTAGKDNSTSLANTTDFTSSENKDKKNKPKKPRTVWSYEGRGDVVIPEICFDSVESRCSNESQGCPRLHALEHYHWQVSENGCNWNNLQPHQVKCLEISYCDMNNDECKLPRFDPAQLQMNPSALIRLLGRDIWLADFKAMQLSDSKKEKDLHLRRLSTEPGKNVKASSFKWYFLDKQKNWVEYGQVDSVGAKDLVSNIASNDIEEAFYKGKPNLTFTNAQFSYVLDFKNMTQTNQNTNVVRDVRRRPEVHLEAEEEEEQTDSKYRKIPHEWENMQQGERLKRVDVPQTSEEYKNTVQLLPSTISAAVTKLERIQNRFHWTAFQNKVEEMTTIYGDIAKVDVRQLFHGTNPTVIQHICSENFDPRLHGQAAGQAYGQGTYFARDANLSYKYCKQDSNNLKYLFIAKVAVGSMALGNSSMVRPPPNSSTGAPCDSTVDNITNSSIIVKYDKAEYYPQYLFTLK